MKYRFYGDELQLVKYELTVANAPTHDGSPAVYLAASDKELDELLKSYPDAAVAEVDNTGYEWLNSMTFTQEQLRAGELEKAIEMGGEAYNEMKNAPTQEEINAMLMLEIAKIKAGGMNE